MRIGYLAFVTLTGSMLALTLGGCAGAKRAFGMQKVAPDEFTVVTKAPLVLPPDYSLRPPQPGAPSPAYVEPGSRAQYALFGRDGQLSDTAGGYTMGEIGLLDTTGGSAADPDIRKTINSETASLIEKDSSVVDDILFWQKTETSEPVIDAEAEAKRLKETGAVKPAEDGESGTETETAPPEPEEKGLF